MHYVLKPPCTTCVVVCYCVLRTISENNIKMFTPLLLCLWLVHVVTFFICVYLFQSNVNITQLPKNVYHNLALSGLGGLPLVFFVFRPNIPLWRELVGVIVCAGLEDVLFYIVHRLMHTGALYRFHRHHHKWQNVHAGIAFDASSVEHILCNVLPVVLLGMFCGLGFRGMVSWFMLSTWGSVSAHGDVTCNHAEHHRRPSYNYGTGVMIVDRLLGTFYKN